MHGSEVYILCDDEDDDGDASCTKGYLKIFFNPGVTCSFTFNNVF